MLAPSGPIYQAGTLSGNPLAMAAGYAALKYIKDNPNLYDILEEKSSYLGNGIKENLNRHNKKFTLNRVGSMLTLFFTEEEVTDFHSAIKSNTNLYGKYFHEMLKRGTYLPPAQFEAFFISTAHTEEDLNKTIKANYESLQEIIK